MKQNIRKTYLQLKAKYPHVILLVRCVDCYQAWDNDAEQICKIIDSIKFLQKEAFTTCHIQINQIDDVLNKMIKAGYKVAICDPL